MDIEKLIDRLYTKQQSYNSYTDSELTHVIEDAITALSTLQAENEKLFADLTRVTAERDALIKRTSGNCWSCIRRYECNSRKSPHRRCWEFDPRLLRED